MKNVKLKKIEHADFRKSEATLFDDFIRRNKYLGSLKSDEVILFISYTENQLIWILNVTVTSSGRRIFDSRRWRIEGSGTWNPLMVANYASEVGLALAGLKRYEEYFTDSRMRRRVERALILH